MAGRVFGHRSFLCWLALAFVCLVTSVVFYLISMGSTHWTNAKPQHRGVFRACDDAVDTCVRYRYDCSFNAGKNANWQPSDSDCESLHAVQAALIIAVILAIIGAVLVTCRLASTPTHHDALTIWIIWIACLSGIFGMIAMAVYAGQFQSVAGASYGYSFGLEIAAWALQFVGAFLLLLVHWCHGREVVKIARRMHTERSQHILAGKPTQELPAHPLAYHPEYYSVMYGTQPSPDGGGWVHYQPVPADAVPPQAAPNHPPGPLVSVPLSSVNLVRSDADVSGSPDTLRPSPHQEVIMGAQT